MSIEPRAKRKSDSSGKQARLNFRLSEELKALIEIAAASSGQSVSDFAVSTLMKSAREIVEREHVTRLSLRDAKRFVEIMGRSDAKPNAALRSAAKSYVKRVRER